jgi:3-hydroxybutyryl-CoA dehydratase
MIAPGLAKFADFDEVAIGQCVAERCAITEAAIDAFAELSGDTNPLHMSDSFAQGAGFAGRVAHGVLLAAYVSRLLGTKFPGPGCFWAKQSFQWRMPVFAGDEIEITVTVKHKSAGTRTLLIAVQARNQHGKLVMDGEGIVSIFAKAAGSEEYGFAAR